MMHARLISRLLIPCALVTLAGCGPDEEVNPVGRPGRSGHDAVDITVASDVTVAVDDYVGPRVAITDWQDMDRNASAVVAFDAIPASGHHTAWAFTDDGTLDTNWEVHDAGEWTDTPSTMSDGNPFGIYNGDSFVFSTPTAKQIVFFTLASSDTNANVDILVTVGTDGGETFPNTVYHVTDADSTDDGGVTDVSVAPVVGSTDTAFWVHWTFLGIYHWARRLHLSGSSIVFDTDPIDYTSGFAWGGSSVGAMVADGEEFVYVAYSVPDDPGGCGFSQEMDWDFRQSDWDEQNPNDLDWTINPITEDTTWPNCVANDLVHRSRPAFVVNPTTLTCYIALDKSSSSGTRMHFYTTTDGQTFTLEETWPITTGVADQFDPAFFSARVGDNGQLGISFYDTGKHGGDDKLDVKAAGSTDDGDSFGSAGYLFAAEWEANIDPRRLGVAWNPKTSKFVTAFFAEDDEETPDQYLIRGSTWSP